MVDAKKDKKFWIGRLLLVILLVFAAWLYYQLELSYRQMEATNQNTDQLLAKQAILTRQYAQEVVEAKQKVVEAEQLVAQVRQENEILQQKVKLLDKMAELEVSITDLKQKNTTLLAEIERLEKEAMLHPEKIKTLDEGKTMMSKFRQRVRILDRRMHEIKREVFDAKVQAQKEMDKKRSLAGNNGFLVRNGMNMPQEIILTTEKTNIKVDVQFVK